MVQILIILSLIFGGIAMAAPRDQNFDPRKQYVSPEGQVRGDDDEPTDAEMFIFMWRQQAGDKPIPEDLRKKYGIRSEVPQLPAGR